MNLDKGHNTRGRDQILTLRNCHFPDCGVEFLGRGKTKYCQEHRKQKYKKILYQKHVSDGIGDANVEIKHKHIKTTVIERECALDGCCHTYELTLIPNQFIYPKYCSEHRNAFKREFFLKQQNKDNDV